MVQFIQFYIVTHVRTEWFDSGNEVKGGRVCSILTLNRPQKRLLSCWSASKWKMWHRSQYESGMKYVMLLYCRAKQFRILPFSFKWQTITKELMTSQWIDDKALIHLKISCRLRFSLYLLNRTILQYSDLSSSLP